MRISAKNQPATSATYLERVNLAVDHIVSHLHEPLRLLEISRVAMMSPFHFHRVFQGLVGETPADFVKRLRLNKSLCLMADSRRHSLTSIALTCGFASSSDFSRCFKQKFGVAPSAFDLRAWRGVRSAELNATVPQASNEHHVERLPSRSNPDKFKVRIRELPARSAAYIRVARPYEPNAVMETAERLVAWAEHRGLADRQWLGYQWDNPEITPLKDCRYHVAVEVEQFVAKGEVGRFEFPSMLVAEVAIKGDIYLELRALQWLYASWLPRSGYLPDDQPCFEAWVGRPFSHGTEHFELKIQLPIRRN